MGYAVIFSEDFWNITDDSCNITVDLLSAEISKIRIVESWYDGYCEFVVLEGKKKRTKLVGKVFRTKAEAEKDLRKLIKYRIKTREEYIRGRENHIERMKEDVFKLRKKLEKL
ncbi:MAG TPA: hypothetical protein VGA67_02805 [Candidatus Dojkabacteria bacterium]